LKSLIKIMVYYILILLLNFNFACSFDALFDKNEAKKFIDNYDYIAFRARSCEEQYGYFKMPVDINLGIKISKRFIKSHAPIKPKIDIAIHDRIIKSDILSYRNITINDILFIRYEVTLDKKILFNIDIPKNKSQLDLANFTYSSSNGQMFPVTGKLELLNMIYDIKDFNSRAQSHEKNFTPACLLPDCT